MIPNPTTFSPEYRADLPSPEAPVISDGVVLESDYSTITLPRPLFGNQEEIQLQRIQRSTRGGDLITYRDTGWVINEIRKVAFDSLSIEQRNAIFEFLSDSLGKPILYTDYEGRQWDVLIVNPNGDITETNTPCGYTWEVWFQIIAEVTGD